MKEKVAIILVNYNGKNYNEECINSILKSTYKNYEIIVVDNNSIDNSVELLVEKFDNNIKIITSESNLGFSGANNLGIKYALENEFDYVMLLNNDTVIDKDMIKIMVDSSFNSVVVSPKIYYYDDKNILWSAGGRINWFKGLSIQYGINEMDNEENNKKKEIEFATGCCILIPIQAIKKVGMMSEDYFLYYEDTDYCVRLIRKGFKIIYEPKAVLYHKVSATTGGEKSKMYWYYMTRNRLIFNKKFNKTISYKIYYLLTMTIKLIRYLVLRDKTALSGSVSGIVDFFKGIEAKRS
ncbi:MAG: glycosyltransferase family 2 protein [Clostridium sp.]|nr:glycosyltransferase family 2 protein [Clostridium sp.]